jgi:ribosomal-protein-alanine N-acetyltransferase
MTSAVRIDPMTTADLDAITALAARSHLDPWPRDSFEAELAHEWSTCLTARIGDAVVGHLVYWKVADELTIMDIATAPEHRRLGIARRLLDLALRDARESGITLLLLEVRASNEPAQALYRSFGFTVSGRRPGYYAAGNEDALLMELPLP